MGAETQVTTGAVRAAGAAVEAAAARLRDVGAADALADAAGAVPGTELAAAAAETAAALDAQAREVAALWLGWADDAAGSADGYDATDRRVAGALSPR